MKKLLYSKFIFLMRGVLRSPFHRIIKSITVTFLWGARPSTYPSGGGKIYWALRPLVVTVRETLLLGPRPVGPRMHASCHETLYEGG